MSLRVRLALAISALVLFTLIGAWALTGRVILRPFAGQVFRNYLDLSVSVADRLEDGANPLALEEELDLQIRPAFFYDGGLILHPPRGSRERGKAARSGERPVLHLEEANHKGHRVHFSKGRRNVVLVELDDGSWVMVRRDLDLRRPTRALGPVLLLVGLGVVAVALVLANNAVKPLETAKEAMEQIADGDLDHRLEEVGPSELSSAAASFNRMADRVQSMMRAEKEMLAGISHELRTPLTRLRLELEMLREVGPSASRLDAMEADLAELDALVGQVTEISRLELAAEPLDLEPVDLTHLCEQLAVRARVEGDGGEIAGDRRLLARAIGNLLRNADRYAPEGELVIRLEPGVVEVLDRGPGVDEALLPLLFDPFVRGETSRAKHTGGLGLGLMIVRQVAELHGGQVSARNRSDGGLAVRLDLRESLR